MGETCYIQNFVDLDPSRNIRDHACLAATYNGHKGTDFALKNLAALSQNFKVHAAHKGVILGSRNSMPDVAINSPNARDLNGRGCGNGVSIGHTDGYETQYCHLKFGSVAVQSGDIDERGAFLGFVGLSGNTEFLYLYFEVRKDGQTIDPFHPQSSPSGSAQTSLWEPNITVDHGGIISSGISTEIPKYSQILEPFHMLQS